jgi:hypothetical protein
LAWNGILKSHPLSSLSTATGKETPLLIFYLQFSP